MNSDGAFTELPHDEGTDHLLFTLFFASQGHRLLSELTSAVDPSFHAANVPLNYGAHSDFP